MTFNNKYSLDDIRSSLTQNNFVALLVFLFPITAATVNGAGDLIMFTLLVLGIKSFRFADLKLLDKDKYIFIGFLALFLVGALSMINTENVAEGLKKLERLAAFPLSIFIYLYFLKNKFNLTQIFINGVMIAAVVMAWQAWYQVEVLGYVNAIGGYHKIIFGDTAMLIAVLLAVYGYFKANDWKSYLLFVILVSFSLYASFLSVTRGAWVLIPVLLVAVVGYAVFHRRAGYKWLAVVFFSITIVGVILFKSDFFYHNFTREFIVLPEYLDGVVPAQGNLQWRIIVWKMSVQIWELNPYIGTGLGDFFLDSSTVLKNGYMNGQMDYVAEHAHSIYFDALATMGLLGLMVVIVSMIFVPLFVVSRIVRQRQSDFYLAASVFLLILSFLVFGLSEGLLSRKFFINLYLLLLLMYIATARSDSRNVSRDVLVKNDSYSCSVGFNVGAKFLSVFLSVSFLCVVLGYYIVGQVKYSLLLPVEKLSADYTESLYEGKIFVFSNKVKLKKDLVEKFKMPYVIAKVENMSCYSHKNSLYIYDYKKFNELYDDDDGKGGFSKIYYSGESDGQSIYISDQPIDPGCGLKPRNTSWQYFIKSNYYTTLNKVIHMHSNGYVMAPIYGSLKGRYRIDFEAKARCTLNECAKIRVEVLRQEDKDSDGIHVINTIIEADSKWGRKSVFYELSNDNDVYLRVSFINDYYNWEEKEDINLYLREITVSRF